MFEYNTAHEAYIDICNKLLNEGELVTPRGLKTKELINVHLCIKNPSDYLTPRTHLTYFFGELFWYKQGINKLGFITEYAPFWSQVANDKEEINSNYGVPVFTKLGLENCREILEEDWSSRKAFIQIGNSQSIFSKDTTCTLNLQYLIRKENNVFKLHQIVTSRSVDANTGIVYDLPFFCILQSYLLTLLNENSSNKEYYPLQLGNYYHNIASFHYYLNKEEEFKKGLQKSKQEKLPPFDYDTFLEFSLASSLEEILRIKKQEIVLNNFQSDFWKKCFQILNKKFIKK